MPHLQLHILGVPRVTDGEGRDLGLPAGKPLALLGLVALEPGGVTRNDAAAILWPASAPDRARASVRQALWSLRKKLDAEAILEGEDGRLRLNPFVLAIDVDSLDRAIRAGDAAGVVGRWNGGPFQGFAVADAPAWNQWASDCHAGLEMRVGSFLESYAGGRSAGDRLPWIEHALSVRPYRESLHVLRVETLLELGRLDEADAAVAVACAEFGEGHEGIFARLENEIRRAVRARYQDEAEEGFHLAFVGRSGEFAALSDLWRAVREGHARTANILGAPGIGKTRLAEEFLALASAGDAAVVRVRGAAVERKLEYGMASVLVRALLSLPGAAGVSNASADALRALVPSSGTGSAAPLPRPSAAALADAMSDLMDAVAEEAPVVLLVDDLHWVDAESRLLLQRAMRLSARTPVLLVQTCRTEEGDASVLRTLRAQAGTGGTRTLELTPLTPEDVVEFLTAGARFPSEGAAAEAGAALHRASRGHPLHLVSLIRSLRDDGILERDGDGWTFHMERLPSELEMPGELRELLARRVGRITEDARSVLAVLARRGSGGRLAALRSETLLSEARFTEAVTELLAADLIRWLNGHRVDFTHDLVREEAARDGAPWVRTSRWRVLGAVAAMTAVLAGAAWGVNRVRPPERPRWAQGEITLTAPDALVRLAPSSLGRWVVVDSLPTEPREEGDFLPTVRLGDGHVLGTIRAQGRGPDVAERHRDGSLRVLLDRGGDDTMSPAALSPDGRWALVLSEDTAALPERPYRRDLLRLDLQTGEAVTLVAPQSGAHATWSPSGRVINVLVDTYAAPDSLLRLRPDGTVVEGFELPVGGSSAGLACGESKVLVSHQTPLALRRWYALDWETRVMEELPLGRLHLAAGVACSPDGAYVAIVDPESSEVLILSVETGEEVDRLPAHSSIAYPYWDGGEPDIPGHVIATAADTILAWGETTGLSATVTSTSGRPWTGPVTWRSLTPAVAAVRGSRVVANAPGIAELVATADGWLEDTVTVRITADQSANLLLGDQFKEFPGETWVPVGDPQPSVIVVDGVRLLSMNSDAVFADGMVTRETFPANQGITVELQFRLPLTDRIDRQSLTLCLWDADPPEAADPSWLPNWRWREEQCVRYPADELTAFDPASIHLGPAGGGGPAIQGIPAPGFGGEAWVDFGIQLRADGRLSAIANGREAAVHPLAYDLHAETRFRILVLARDADTDLWIRNLTVWRGIRY